MDRKSKEFFDHYNKLEEDRDELHKLYKVSTHKSLMTKINQEQEELNELKEWLLSSTACKTLGNAKKRVLSWSNSVGVISDNLPEWCDSLPVRWIKGTKDINQTITKVKLLMKWLIKEGHDVEKVKDDYLSSYSFKVFERDLLNNYNKNNKNLLDEVRKKNGQHLTSWT